jgi:hypothetical protein
MSTQQLKRLPYGSTNFESIITEGYAYVDKTRFIALLEAEANRIPATIEDAEEMQRTGTDKLMEFVYQHLNK